LILAFVSLWLLVNSIKKNPKEKRPIDFFGLFYSKIFLIILLLFCLFFCFKCDYGVKDRLNFILTEIKRYYNSNDRWKFILLLIRRENGLNKIVKARQKGYGKQTK